MVEVSKVRAIVDRNIESVIRSYSSCRADFSFTGGHIVVIDDITVIQSLLNSL